MLSHEQKTKETVPPRFLSLKQASLLTGIGHQALRTYADNGSIASYRTPSGQRKFDYIALQKMCSSPVPHTESETTSSKQNYLYARVSSKKQLDDLLRQVEALRNSSSEYSSFGILQDVGSGINFKRKGLQTILDSCLQGVIGKVVVAHRDRLCRFGFELIETIVNKAGGEIIVLETQKNKSSEAELADDLLSIVHIYSCRQMGRRKYGKGKRNMQENCNQVELETIETFQ